MSIVLTPFARARLFPREPRGNTIQDCTPEAFERLSRTRVAGRPLHIRLDTGPRAPREGVARPPREAGPHRPHDADRPRHLRSPRP